MPKPSFRQPVANILIQKSGLAYSLEFSLPAQLAAGRRRQTREGKGGPLGVAFSSL